MKKTVSCILAAVLLCLAACGTSASNEPAITPSPQPTPEPTPEPEPEIPLLEIGKAVTTDTVEFVLDECRFARKLGLNYDNWLQPASGTGGLVPGDGKIYIYFSFHVKNISKNKLNGYDVCNAIVDYNDGFIFEDAVFTSGMPSWSTNAAVSEFVGLEYVDPLTEHAFRGYIKCSAEVRGNRSAPLNVVFTLPDSSGDIEFVYTMEISEDLADKAVYELVLSLDRVKDNLDFVVRNVENAAGSKFADSYIEEMIENAGSVDISGIPETLTNTITAVPEIQEQVLSIAESLRKISSTDVEGIKSLSQDVIDLIDSLLDGELSGV